MPCNDPCNYSYDDDDDAVAVWWILEAEAAADDQKLLQANKGYPRYH